MRHVIVFMSWLMMTIGEDCQGALGLNRGKTRLGSGDGSGFWLVNFRHRIENFFFQSAVALCAMATAASVAVPRIALVCMTALSLTVRFLAAVALDMRRTRPAETSTVGALRHRTTLFIDVGERTIRVLTIAHAMSSHASLASILFPIDQHGGWMKDVDATNLSVAIKR